MLGKEFNRKSPSPGAEPLSLGKIFPPQTEAKMPTQDPSATTQEVRIKRPLNVSKKAGGIATAVRKRIAPQQPPKGELVAIQKKQFDHQFRTSVLYGRAALSTASFLTRGLIDTKANQRYRANLNQHFYEEPVPETRFDRATTLFHYNQQRIGQERGREYRNRVFAKHAAALALVTTVLVQTPAAHVDMTPIPHVVIEVPDFVSQTISQPSPIEDQQAPPNL